MPVKITQKLSLAEESLNKQEQNMISILSTQDGFSFAVYDKERNKFLALEAYDFENIHQNELEESFSNHLFAALQAVFEKSKIIPEFKTSKGVFTFAPNQATWLPLPLFNAEEKERYILLDFGEAAGEAFYEVNNLVEAACVYTAYPSFLKNMQSVFPNTVFHPLQNLLTKDFQRFSKKNAFEKSVFCFVEKERLYIQVYNASKLLFDNCFPIQNKQDFVYFLLNVYDKLELSPENTPLFFTGAISKNDDYWNTIKKYIRRVETMPANNSFQYSHLFKTPDTYHFYHLFNNVTCALLEEFGKEEE